MPIYRQLRGFARNVRQALRRQGLLMTPRPYSAGPTAPVRQWGYIGHNTAITRTVYGHKLFVDTRDMSLTPHLLLDGDWENWIAKVVRSAVKPGMVAVEVGANCGFYSLIIADAIGPTGKLHAFDANPRMVELATKSLEINGFRDRSHVYNYAVADIAGKMKFNILEERMGSSSLQDIADEAAAYSDRVHSVEVDAISLDNVLEQVQRIDFLKIDAEGAEPKIFEGAKSLIARSSTMLAVVEFAPSRFPTKEEARSYLEMLTGMGFRIQSISTQSSLESRTIDQLLREPWSELFLSKGSF